MTLFRKRDDIEEEIHFNKEPEKKLREKEIEREKVQRMRWKEFRKFYMNSLLTILYGQGVYREVFFGYTY